MRISPAISVLAVALLTGCASTSPSSSSHPSSSSGSASAADVAQLVATARSQLGELTHAAGAYELIAGHCPASIDDLVHPPSGGPLIASVPNDPWGHPVAFMPAGPENPANAFVSAGPDGELLTPDDVLLRAECSSR